MLMGCASGGGISTIDVSRACSPLQATAPAVPATQLRLWVSIRVSHYVTNLCAYLLGICGAWLSEEPLLRNHCHVDVRPVLPA